MELRMVTNSTGDDAPILGSPRIRRAVWHRGSPPGIRFTLQVAPSRLVLHEDGRIDDLGVPMKFEPPRIRRVGAHRQAVRALSDR
jgi:hypothetical protein